MKTKEQLIEIKEKNEVAISEQRKKISKIEYELEEAERKVAFLKRRLERKNNFVSSIKAKNRLIDEII